MRYTLINNTVEITQSERISCCIEQIHIWLDKSISWNYFFNCNNYVIFDNERCKVIWSSK